MSNKRIVYFDYWTVGIKHFAFFDQKLKDKGFETKLIHLNSWRELEGPEFQTLSGIDCYDIRFYKTNLIYEILKKEAPLAVVMLNASFITDRTVILACKKLNIKCIYLAHGSLTRTEFIDNTIRSMNQSIKKTRVKRAVKHLRRTVVNYLHALMCFDRRYVLRGHGYKVILNTFLNPGKYLFFPPHSFDLEPDLILVYGHTERKLFSERLKHRAPIVKVTGMPDLDMYFQHLTSLSDNREKFLNELSIPTDRPYITYIEEGLLQDRLWTVEETASFLETLRRACADSGFHLVVKLHPRTANSHHRSLFDNLEGTTILDQVDFPKLIYFTDKCVSHYSTTLIYPILLDKPILVPRWGKSAALVKSFSEKEVTYVYTIAEFLNKITATEFNHDRSEYLANFVPFTDGKTSDRIVAYILESIL